MLRTPVVAALVLAVVVVVVDVQAACRFWCPAKEPKGAVYCCDDGSGQGDFAVHPGRCPRRDVCPGGFLALKASPRVCAHDGQCARNEKCCPDVCLTHHTCLLADRP